MVAPSSRGIARYLDESRVDFRIPREQRPQPVGLLAHDGHGHGLACSIQANASSSTRARFAAHRRARAAGSRRRRRAEPPGAALSPARRLHVAIEDRRVAAGEREVHVLRRGRSWRSRDRPSPAVPGRRAQAGRRSGDGDVSARLEDGVDDDSGGERARDGAVGDEVHGCRPRRAAATRSHRRRLRDSASSAVSMQRESVVGPSTRPSAVVASATSSSAPRRAAAPRCSARSHRVSPLRRARQHRPRRVEDDQRPAARRRRAPPSARRAGHGERKRQGDRDGHDERHGAADALPQRQLARFVEHAAPEQQRRQRHAGRPQLDAGTATAAPRRRRRAAATPARPPSRRRSCEEPSLPERLEDDLLERPLGVRAHVADVVASAEVLRARAACAFHAST